MRDEEIFRTPQAAEVLSVLKRNGVISKAFIFGEYRSRESAKALIKQLFAAGLVSEHPTNGDLLLYRDKTSPSAAAAVTESIVAREKIYAAIRSLQAEYENVFPQKVWYNELLIRGFFQNDIHEWNEKLFAEGSIKFSEAGSIIVLRRDMRLPPDDGRNAAPPPSPTPPPPPDDEPLEDLEYLEE